MMEAILNMPAQVALYQQKLADAGVVFMDALPGKKRTKRDWDYYDALHAMRGRSRLDLVPRWMEEGGAMYRPTGKRWTLDCDDQETTEHTEAFLACRELKCPQVATPGGGRHFEFLLPSELYVPELKNHVNRAGGRKWDFKFGPRTALMLVGSKTPKGIYLPHTPWSPPPVVDPRDLESSIQPLRAATPFLQFNRPGPPARFAAKGFLRSPLTQPSVSGEGGHHALLSVASNMIRYYLQTPHNALTMIMREDPDGLNWNQRCRYQDGTPFPWSEDEIYNALLHAQDEVPSLGIWQYKEAQHEAEVQQRLADYSGQLACQLRAIAENGGSIPPLHTEPLYWAFLEENGWNGDLPRDRPIDRKAFTQSLMGVGIEIGRKGNRSAIVGISI